MAEEDWSDEQIAAEIARLRARIDALEGGPAGPRPSAPPVGPTPSQDAPLRELAIHSMPLANRDHREYFLFYDLFVHSDRRKLCAVAPWYGDDFDFAAQGVDPDDVELRLDGLRVRGTRIPYGQGGWEPSVLFDFEHPDLAARIAAEPELPVQVVSGGACRSFWLDTRPPPAHEVSLALCVKDENRWLGVWLEYWLDVLGVDHVYVYDNRTRDKRALRALLAPWSARGRVTYVPWDFEWRNRLDGKQIGQPPQESHTLARFGADRWIGFFDTDEFLHVPDGDLKGLLARHDPSEIGALGFKMRWALYKGPRSFDDVLNPLVEMVHVREDPNWRKRWKLFVSPERVRFMRFHWIQEDQKTVHLPEIHYHHYFLRDFRFEEGKGDEGLGAETWRDETLRGVWERHANAPGRARRHPAAPDSRLVAHVEESLARALRGESKLHGEVFEIPGMIGDPTRHLFNNLGSLEGGRLLEIGAWQGASTFSFLHENQLEATVVDDWSGFGNQRERFLANLARFRGRSRVTLLEGDCFQLDPSALGRYELYYYDGDHSKASQYRAMVEFHRFLADEAIVLVDDWNRREVRDGTRRGLAETGAEILYAREITAPEAPRPGDGKIETDPRSWWNGLACFVLKRS